MPRIHLLLTVLALAAASTVCGGATARPLPTHDSVGSDNPPPKATPRSGADQSALTLTVYQNGLGLVHDVRWVTLSPASLELTLSGLPERLQPETLAVSLEADAHVLRQRFHSGDWTLGTLLQAYRGSEVLLMPRAGESGPTRRGMLVSAAGDHPIVRVGERLEIGGPDAPWRIVFPPNPGVDVTGPALELSLSSAISGRHRLDLIYLADGLDWQMGYWGELQGNELKLEGFARISNHSGGDYADAKLRLVAGDVAGSDRVRPVVLKAQRMVAAEAAASEPVMAWHLYRVGQSVSLPEAAALRLKLLQVERLAVRRHYRVNGNATDDGGEAPVEARLHVDTASARQPIALPAGTVRIRELGPEGEPRFLGADQIGHTPAGKPLELVLGTAFDVTAKRTRELFQRLGKNHYEVGWRIELHNAGAQPVTVEVREYLPGDWKIVQQSAPYERLSSAAVQWSVTVPATGAAAVSYQARYIR